MQEGTSVLEYRLKNDKTNLCYFSIASALKIDYCYQFCEGSKEDNDQNDVDFVVDISKLEQNIKIMLNEKT